MLFKIVYDFMLLRINNVYILLDHAFFKSTNFTHLIIHHYFIKLFNLLFMWYRYFK